MSASQAPSLPAGVRLTHPERVYWPDPGVTKGALAAYHLAVAERLLPYVAGRPLTLVRCPEGVPQGCFFQKHAWRGMSRAVSRRRVDGEEMLHVGNVEGLLALVQAGALEIHPWGARTRTLERPDTLTVDLDPDEAVPSPALAAAAREVRERLRAKGLESFLKTTGGKGLHVVAPLLRGPTWDTLKAFAEEIAAAMVGDAPGRFTTASSKAARRGRIFIDYLRNTRGATAVAPYSPRARPGATVAMPLAWDELGDGVEPRAFTVLTAPGRLEGPDPWAGYPEIRQRLPESRARA